MTPNYLELYNTMEIRKSRLTDIAVASRMILRSTQSSLYHHVEDQTNIPWYFVGILHYMECNCRFDQHLYNGDPLTARTVNDPKHQPTIGNPPFAWDFSAACALRYDQLDRSPSFRWTVTEMLADAERYNGEGYHHHNINSPYLWSFTNHYQIGKFDRDGHYNPKLVSDQVGVAPLLWTILNQLGVKL